MGRMLVIPSRAESLPYVVLEAAAAGMPIIATAVGGIPEIFGPQADHLIPPTIPARWPARSRAALDDPAQVHRVAAAVTRRGCAASSRSTAMVEGGMAAYREAIAMRKLAQFT